MKFNLSKLSLTILATVTLAACEVAVVAILNQLIKQN